MTEKKELREGFTTGTCAAAAAGMAAFTLCFGRECPEIFIPLPGREPARITAKELIIRKDSVLCSVKKDAGDDPDVTNGCLVKAEVSFLPPAEEAVPRGIPLYSDGDYPGLFLTGGEGIGIVTKKGLSCPVGNYAINPGPRSMILSACQKAKEEAGKPEAVLLIKISIPEGKELAARTFNPRLGITGGISVLGSTGIVRPMSEEAIRETIRLDIRMRVAEGARVIGFIPGNYGERFFREYTGLSAENLVTCSNYIGDAARMAAEEGAKKLFLAGHAGKLVKVAGGIMNTHSRYGDHRMEILSACAGDMGAPEMTVSGLLSCNTTDEAFELLEMAGYRDIVAAEICRKIRKAISSYAGIPAEVILFSERGYLSRTDGFDAFLEEWKRI